MFSEQILISEFKQKLDRVIEKTKEEIVTIKTGKASPVMVESLMVLSYGGTTKLKLLELATIMTEGASGLLIAPFDPSTVQDIEKAILSSPLNLTPRVDGKNIHIKIPPLSEEQRKQMLKTVSTKIEEGKVAMRHDRDEARKKVKAAQEEKTISEDDKFRIEKDIDKITHEYTLSLEELKSRKEKELMEV